MAGYDALFWLLAKLNFWAWVIALAGGFYMYTKYPKTKGEKSKGWLLMVFGSLFVVARELIKLLPSYETNETVYIARYIVGGAGAFIITVGVMTLGIDVITKKVHFEG